MLQIRSEPSNAARAAGLLQGAVTEPPHLRGSGLQEILLWFISVPENPRASPAKPCRALHKYCNIKRSSPCQLRNKNRTTTLRICCFADQPITNNKKKEGKKQNDLSAITSTDPHAFAAAPTLLLLSTQRSPSAQPGSTPSRRLSNARSGAAGLCRALSCTHGSPGAALVSQTPNETPLI